MRALLIPALLAAAATLTACSTQPAVTSERTMMRPSEIAAMGLECKPMKNMDTIIRRTVCASPEAWDNLQDATIRDSELLFQAIRSVR